MSDLDITIKLDPTQPVQGAKAVTKEVAKLEDQAKSTQKAAEGIAKLNFKQAAAGANQAFELINQKLKITDNAFGEVVGSAVKFGAAGAQIAGPWGAAIGAVVGALVSMDGVFDEVIAKHKELTGTAETTADMLARLTKDSWSTSESFDRLGKNARTTTEAIALMTAHIANLHAQSGKVAQSFAAIWPALKAANQGIKDFNLLMDLSGAGAAKKYHDQVDAINRVLKDHPEFAHLAERALAGLAGSQDKATASTNTHTQALIAQRKALSNLVAKDLTDDLVKRLELIEKFNETPRLPSFMGNTRDSSITGVAAQYGGGGDALSEQMKQIEANTKKWNLELGRSSDALTTLNDIGKTAISSLENQIVQLATTGKGSFRDMANAMLAELTRVAAHQVFASLISGLGSLGSSTSLAPGVAPVPGGVGFASGGTIFPSGNGTSDSQTVMFRKSPSETVHINTPAQESAYRRGGGGGGGSPAPATVRVVNEVRRGELLSDRDVVVALGRNRDAVRRLIG